MNENDKREREINTNNIIKNHVLWSMGAGLIPVPIADFFAVSAIQLDLVRQICKMYDVSFRETDGKAIVGALTGTGLARLGAGVVKFIPGVGTVLGSLSMSILSGGSTYALGQVFKKHFETGGTILDFDIERLKKIYNEQFEKGKKVARDLKNEKEAEKVKVEVKEKEPSNREKAKGILNELKDLTALRDSDAITPEEYDKIKKQLLDELDS